MKKGIQIGLMSVMILGIALSAINCTGSNEFVIAKKVAYGNKVAWESIQLLAGTAYLDWEDAVNNGTEIPTIYLDDERLAKFREIDNKVILAQRIYVDALKTIEVAGEDANHINLFAARAELVGLMTSGILLLEDFGVVGRGEYIVNNDDASLSTN